MLPVMALPGTKAVYASPSIMSGSRIFRIFSMLASTFAIILYKTLHKVSISSNRGFLFSKLRQRWCHLMKEGTHLCGVMQCMSFNLYS